MTIDSKRWSKHGVGLANDPSKMRMDYVLRSRHSYPLKNKKKGKRKKKKGRQKKLMKKILFTANFIQTKAFPETEKGSLVSPKCRLTTRPVREGN